MKHPLQQIFDEAGLNTMSYSGRSMYGKKCLAVVCNDWKSILPLIIESVDDENRDQLANAVSKIKNDSFGHDIVVYFPGIDFEDEDTEEEP